MADENRSQRQETYVDKTMHWCKGHLTSLKGLLALTFGIVLIFITGRLILNLLVFFAGAALVYHGLTVLGVKQATDFIDRLLGRRRGGREEQQRN